MIGSSLMKLSPHLANHGLMGASTGYMRDLRGDWPALVERAQEVSMVAVELGAVSEPELPGLVAYLESEPVVPFHYISLHAPSKQRLMPEAELVHVLLRAARRVHAIVVHPDTLHDLGPWTRLGSQLLIENMDARKERGKTADELQSYFDALPKARLCFDIAHAWAIDHSMGEAQRILDRHGWRLRQVHISSLDQDLHHVPLTREDETIFGPLLDRCRDVPWILEAPPRSEPATGVHPRDAVRAGF